MMSPMKEQCTYVCGPYKDYCGRAEYDDEAGIFHGEVIGTQDVVTFQGKNLSGLRKAFCDSVDDYLTFCAETGQPPEKPHSGKFVARLDPELHKRVSIMAQAEGVSLNQFVCNCLEAMTRAEAIRPCPTPILGVGARPVKVTVKTATKKPTPKQRRAKQQE